MLFVPLMNGGVPIGLIAVTRVETGAFATTTSQLLQTFADQAVIAIENTRLFNETQEALERQTATADILKVIASSPSDVQPVFDAIATSAKRLLGGFSTAVFRLRRRHGPRCAAFTPTNPAADAALQSRISHAGGRVRTVRDGRSRRGRARSHDTEELPTSRDAATLRGARGFRSMLSVPLMSDGEPIGADRRHARRARRVRRPSCRSCCRPSPTKP